MLSGTERGDLGWFNCSRVALAVALANKNARMVWALMTSGERYREPLPTAASELRAGYRAEDVGKGKEELMHKAG
ncbi:hypothetical protein [Erythrobacter sp. QSSC1-22B]|uniref:hypothetical protein n=1 Tax=Erythrobacter sp. QSSC1-22B TaxID=1860125 RepID=UPI001F37D424|nr:hypothetical protein [Erythrobacter sp. QSSC1-22B]